MQERRLPPPTVKQLCEGVRHDNPEPHIIVCPVCGQMFDCKDAEDVAHHTLPDHRAKLN